MISLKRFKNDLWPCVAYGALSGTVIAILTRDGIMLSWDSINYISMAKNFGTAHWTESLIATWPPFYPMLISFVNSLGFVGEESARIISAGMYAVLVPVIFLLARATAGRLAAHLTSISMLFFAPLLFVYSYGWSETVYITTSAISLLALHQFYTCTHSSTRKYLVWGALFVGLALLARYIGVALFLAGFLIILFKREGKIWVDKVKSLTIFSVLAWVPVTVYITGCSYYKGQLPGYGDHPMPSLWENAIRLLGTIYRDLLTLELGFANPSLFPYRISWRPDIPLENLGKMAALVFLLLVVSCFLLRKPRNMARGQVVPLTYIACYISSLLVLTSVWVPINIATRFCAPMYPLLLLSAFSLLLYLGRGVVQRKARLALWSGGAIVVLCFWSIQLVSSTNVYMRTVRSQPPAARYSDITGDGIYDVSDIMYLANYLFRGGPQPRPIENANVNCDHTVNMGDVVHLINYVLKDGKPPCHLIGH
jgi:hypothetical protein